MRGFGREVYRLLWIRAQVKQLLTAILGVEDVLEKRLAVDDRTPIDRAES